MGAFDKSTEVGGRNSSRHGESGGVRRATGQVELTVAGEQ